MWCDCQAAAQQNSVVSVYVWSGGIRTSMIATSGWCSATAAFSASASPTAAATSCPRSVRISVRPALITAESSAMTMRMPVCFQAWDGSSTVTTGRGEVGDGLDRGRRALRDVGDELHGDRAARGQGSQRVGQAVVHHGGVDAAGQGPQLGDRLDGAALGVVHELGDPGEVHWGGVSSELLLG